MIATETDTGTTDMGAGFGRGLLVLCFLIAALLGLGWWKIMPQGFPPDHPRFWMNTVLPWAAVGAFGLGFLFAVRKRDVWLCGLVLLSGGALTTAVAAGRYWYPQSVGTVLAVVLSVLACFALLPLFIGLCLLWKRSGPFWLKLLFLFLGALTGAFVPWSQRAPTPSTKPSNPDRGTAPATPAGPSTRAWVNGAAPQPSHEVDVDTETGRVTVAANGLTLQINPLLTFHSCSPDRFWTVLAPPATRKTPQVFVGSFGPDSNVLEYKDNGRSRLAVTAGEDGDPVQIDSTTELARPVFAHLNSYCELVISGGDKLGVAFSPCPDVIDLRYSSYPVGSPTRLACLDADGTFQVAEAASAEKGPFRQLAHGPLAAGEPLVITIYSAGKPVFAVTLADWTAQASTALSPTAGWGLPQNAIQFSLMSRDDTGSGSICISLAGTSIGRGWDSVGHTAGTYRNRLTVLPLAPAD